MSARQTLQRSGRSPDPVSNPRDHRSDSRSGNGPAGPDSTGGGAACRCMSRLQRLPSPIRLTVWNRSPGMKDRGGRVGVLQRHPPQLRRLHGLTPQAAADSRKSLGGQMRRRILRKQRLQQQVLASWRRCLDSRPRHLLGRFVITAAAFIRGERNRESAEGRPLCELSARHHGNGLRHDKRPLKLTARQRDQSDDGIRGIDTVVRSCLSHPQTACGAAEYWLKASYDSMPGGATHWYGSCRIGRWWRLVRSARRLVSSGLQDGRRFKILSPEGIHP